MNEDKIPELTEEEKKNLLSRLEKSRFDVDQIGGDHHEPNDGFIQPTIASTVFWLAKFGARIVGFAEVDGSVENCSCKGPYAVVCEREDGFRFWDHVETEMLEGWKRQLAPAPAFDKEIVMTELGRNGATVTRKMEHAIDYVRRIFLSGPNEKITRQEIAAENARRSAQVIPAMIGVDCQPPEYRFGDIYLVSYLPLSDDAFLEALLHVTHFGSRVDERSDVRPFIREALDEDCFCDNPIFAAGREFNPATKLAVQIPGDHSLLFRREVKLLGRSEFDQLTSDDAAYEFVQFQDVNEAERGRTYSFANDDERDIYLAAVLEGASKAAAFALAKGAKIDDPDDLGFQDLAYLSGYWRLTEMARKALGL